MTRNLTSFERDHFEQIKIELNETDVGLATSFIEDELSLKKLGGDSPIVIVCENGSLSRQISINLINKNFLNVYYIEGGIESLKE